MAKLTDEEKRERNKLYQKRWREKAKDKIRLYRREYVRKQRAAYTPEEKLEYNAMRKKWSQRPSRIAKTKRFLDFVAEVKSFYGCSNPACSAVNLDPVQLDFHHLDPSQKSRNVSTMRNCRTDKVTTEMCKCCILCANCHRLETWGKLDCSQFRQCCVGADWKLPFEG